MFMVAFSLLMVVGAFAAWRQNPMYSLWRTVRFVAVVGLGVGALVLGILGVIKLTANSSEGVKIGGALGMVMVGTVGMIAAIVEMSAPPGKALPKGTKLLRVHRAKVDVWAKRAGWTVLVLGILILVLPGDWKVAPGVIGTMVVLLSCSMLSAGYLSARKMDQWLTEVELRPWVRWTYTAEQWKAWNEMRVAKVVNKPPQFVFKRDWKKILVPMAAVAVCLYIFGPGGWVWKTVYVVGIFGLILLLATFATDGGEAEGERLGKKLNAAAPEVWFGDEGMFVDGEFLPWVSAGVYLLGAYRAAGQPASLAFQFMKVGAGTANAAVTQGVLLPVGVEADLERLQRELAVKCPKVGVDLV